jgi:hypothetical protein
MPGEWALATVNDELSSLNVNTGELKGTASRLISRFQDKGFAFVRALSSGTSGVGVVRSASNGYYRPMPLAGYESDGGEFAVWEFSADSRFMSYGGSRGADVVDAVLDRHHGVVPRIDNASGEVRFAPAGYYFSVGYGSIQQYSKVTASGLAPMVNFPPGTAHAAFSKDGNALFSEISGELHVAELPNRPRRVLPNVPGGTLSRDSIVGQRGVGVSDDGSSMNLRFKMDTGRRAIYRVTPHGSATLLTDPGRDALWARAFDVGILAMYESDFRAELTWHDAAGLGQDYDLGEVIVPPPTVPDTARVVGRHVDFTALHRRHFAAADASGLHELVLGANDTVCVVTPELLVYRNDAARTLEFVSLRSTEPKVIGNVSYRGDDYDCATKHTSKDEFLYVDAVGVFVVTFDGETLGTPRHVVDAKNTFRIELFSGTTPPPG